MSDFDSLGKIIFLGSSVCLTIIYRGFRRKKWNFAIKEAVSGNDEDVADGKSYILATIDTNIKADAFVCQLSTNDASHNKPFEFSDSYAKEKD